MSANIAGLEKSKIYFASDFHLGAPDEAKSKEREKLIVSWLDQIKSDAKEVYLVGDIFDFWFEYNQAIPKGFIRFQGKVAELVDSGIPVHFFIGNHDMWMFDYFKKELGVEVFREPILRDYSGKKFYIGHGDGLGPGDYGYKFIKKVFANKVCQWLFARLHPNFGIGLANYLSRSSRKKSGHHDAKYLGEEKEWLVAYCKDILKENHHDYFIFGHRHLPLNIELSNSRYVNLGDWLQYYTYAVFDGNELTLKSFKEGDKVYKAKNEV